MSVATSGRWAHLVERSDRPAVQEKIRRAIRAGEIRVVPGESGRIRIIPEGCRCGTIGATLEGRPGGRVVAAGRGAG
jgi:ribosomal protein L18E